MNRAEAHLHIGRARAGKEDCISLRKLPNYQVEYAGYVVLSNVKFAVQPSGLKRFRDTGQKNVHAYVRGTLVDSTANQPTGIKPVLRGMREAYYNPNVTDTFVDKTTGDAVYSCDTAVLYGTKVYYV
jgi:hypothetical protein